MMSRKYILPVFLAGLLAFAACKKDEVLPPNPYDDVDYGQNGDTAYVPDPNSIVGIYENILTVKCNIPGCHDGHFEPDYRSIQSSWSTMVYHTVTKNTPDSSFQYRVMPGDADASILMHRITQGDAQLQQMPATGDLMTAAEIDNIRTWINNGAKDMFGNMPILPNNEPQVLGMIAYDMSFTTQLDVTENRLDSLPYNPFKVDQGITFNLVILVEDDSTETQDLLVNQVKKSLDMNDFSGATVSQATYLTIPPFEVWVAQISTAPYAATDTVYMRYYVNDGDHPSNTEFPYDDMADAYKTYAAFYVNP